MIDYGEPGKRKPARKQSRRTISMSGDTYRRIAADCRRRGTSIAGTVEALVLEWLRKSEADA